MFTRRSRILASLICAIGLALWTDARAEPPRTQLHVLADPSIQVPLARALRHYSRQEHVAVGVSFAASDELTRQLEAGTQADVMITLRQDVADALKNKGLVDLYSQTNLTKNRLCMVTWHDNPFQLILIPKLPLADILSKLDPDFAFLMADPATMDYGVPSMEALINHQLAEKMEPHFGFVQAYADMPRQIASRKAYGIMLCSDAAFNPALKVLGTFPETAHGSLTYRAMVIAGDNMKAARAFVAWLSSAEGVKYFTERGFQELTVPNSDNDHLARGSVRKSLIQPL